MNTMLINLKTRTTYFSLRKIYFAMKLIFLLLFVSIHQMHAKPIY